MNDFVLHLVNCLDAVSYFDSACRRLCDLVVQCEAIRSGKNIL